MSYPEGSSGALPGNALSLLEEEGAQRAYRQSALAEAAERAQEASFHTKLAEEQRGRLTAPNSQQSAFLGTKEGLLLGEACSTLRGSLDGRGVGAERTRAWSMCGRVPVLLPEAIVTLLIDWTPISNKKLKKKKLQCNMKHVLITTSNYQENKIALT